MTVAEIEAGGPEADGWEQIDANAIDAAKWTDKEIGKVISEIKNRGVTDTHGVTTINFGKLFVETDQIFDVCSSLTFLGKAWGGGSFTP